MNRSARLGILIITASALLLVVLFLIGSRTFLFSSTMEVKSRFNQVAVFSLVRLSSFKESTLDAFNL